MKIIRQIIQYVIPLVIAILLFKYAYRDFDFNLLSSQLSNIKSGWILISVCFSLVSHLVRAYRWKLLLEGLGYRVTLLEAFIALKIGYASNLLMPKLGELLRCTILKKHTDISTSISLGTVVGERTIDLFSLVIVLGLSLVIAFHQLKNTLYATLIASINPSTLKILGLISLLFIIFVSLVVVTIRHSQKMQTNTWLLTIQRFLKGIWQGINSIRLFKQRSTILVLSVLMWLLYYLAGYVGVFAITETRGLDWSAGLSILAISSISLTIPVQGGIGAYHWLVSNILVSYGISKGSAMLYVTLMHTSQLLMTLLGGGICLIIGFFLPKKIIKQV